MNTRTRTLIVDDEPEIRFLIRHTIEEANDGLEVAGEAGDGQAALDAWRDDPPDVIILDERMPGMSGLETAARILEERPDQRIVIFSACLNELVIRGAAELGVKACISKEQLFNLPDRIREVAV